MLSRKQHEQTLEGTGRIEAFSDGVIAIIVTILILEIHVPQILTSTNMGAWQAIVPILPKLAVFLVSFVTVAIFWVNHYHFFHPIQKSENGLLWHNNHVLFWLTVVPFVTAFLGDYPTVSIVVAIYGFVLFMAASAFTLMLRHVFFHGDLLPSSISLPSRKRQHKRALLGVFSYGLSVVLAFVHPYISIAIFVLIPLYYFLPEKFQQ